MATDMFYRASPELFRRAKELRAGMTPSERILWKCLRNNQVDGFRFKAQHPLSTFIANFYCHTARLVVEIDGEIHQQEQQHDYDNQRTHLIEEFGIEVLRFTNQDVYHNLTGVIEMIKQKLIQRANN